MCLPNFQPDVLKYLEDIKNKLSLSTRKKIVGTLYYVKEKDITPWMTKKLDNTLWFNRDEICNDVQALILKTSFISHNQSEDHFFCGFTETEKNMSAKKQEEYANKFANETEMALQLEVNTQCHSINTVNIDNPNHISNNAYLDRLTEEKNVSMLHNQTSINNVVVINETGMELKTDSSRVFLGNRSTNLTHHSTYKENKVQMLTPLTLVNENRGRKKSLKKFNARPSEFKTLF